MTTLPTPAESSWALAVSFRRDGQKRNAKLGAYEITAPLHNDLSIQIDPVGRVIGLGLDNSFSEHLAQIAEPQPIERAARRDDAGHVGHATIIFLRSAACFSDAPAIAPASSSAS